LSEEIRNQINSPPIVVTLTKPQRVELVDNELIQYQQEKERQRRAKEAAIQRQLLINELNLVSC
jgi:hypothetical protein